MHSILEEEGHPVAILDSLLAMIRQSVGSYQYRTLFVRTSGQKAVDVIGDGDLACALYVSALLSLFRLMHGGIHTTVAWTIKDLMDSGWYEDNALQPGSVIIWAEKLCTDGLHHRHIGFFMGDDLAISNDPRNRSPQVHHYTYGEQDGQPVRVIEAIYFHEALKK